MTFQDARWRGKPATKKKPATRIYPRLEILEDRLTPTFFTWTGLGGNQLWSNPNNWDSGAPSPADGYVDLSFPNTANIRTAIDDIAGLHVANLDFFGSNFTIAASPSGLALSIANTIGQDVAGTNFFDSSLVLNFETFSATSNPQISFGFAPPDAPAGIVINSTIENINPFGITSNRLEISGSFPRHIASVTDSVQFNGNNSGYSGGIGVDSGATAEITNDAALGTGVVLVSDGTLSAIGSRVLSNPIKMFGSGTILGTDFVTLNGPITDYNSQYRGPLTLDARLGVILGGTNTYTAGTIVEGGGVAVTNNSALGTGQVVYPASAPLVGLYGGITLANNMTIQGGTLSLPETADLTLTGAIDGVGSVMESGGGSVTLSGANSYGGGTVGAAGTLKLGNNSALGSGPLTLQNGTAIGGAVGSTAISNSISLTGTITSVGGGLTLNGTISGNGALVQNSAEKILVGTDLAGVNTYQGSTTVNGGIVVIDNSKALPGTTALTIGPNGKVAPGADISIGSLAGAGTLQSNGFNPHAIITGSDNTDSTFSGTITGPLSFALASSLTKVGAGTFTFTGTGNVTGLTNVSQGVLQLDGSVGGGAVVLSRLTGTGTVFGVAQISGSVKAGDAGRTGTLSTRGGITFSTGSADNVELGGTTAGAFDQIASGGTITIGNAVLNVSLVNSFTPAIGQSFTIINNTGGKPIVGTFLNMPEGSGFLINNKAMQISYVGGAGHDVVLTVAAAGQPAQLTASAAPTTSYAGTPTQITIGAVDSHRVPVNSITDKVHFTSSDPGATLPADGPLSGPGGTFAVTFRTQGSQTVTVTDVTNGAILPANSNAVMVNPVATATYNFLVSAPAFATPGAALPVTVMSRVANDNSTGPNYTGVVHLTSSDSSATFSSNNVTLTGGAGTFMLTFSAGATGGEVVSATDMGTSGITGTSNVIQVGSGTSTAASVLTVAPSTATPATNTGFDVSVTAKNLANVVAQAYTGTVSLTSDDPLAPILGSHAFTSADNGAYVFHDIALKTSGRRTITALDTTSTNPIVIGFAKVNAVGLTTALAKTPTGFTATFNQPINPADLTLYGKGTTVQDVLLVGQNTNSGQPYPGTLIVDASKKLVTFNVSSNFLAASNPGGSAALPDDTYTVTLLSGVANNGFQDVSGQGIDDGHGGHADFVGTFTTTYQHDKTQVLGISDFARGPNASGDTSTLIKVPNDPANGGHVGIPITIYNSANLTSAGFTLTYNANILTVTGGVSDPSNAAATFQMTSNVMMPDGVHSVATFAFTCAKPTSGTQILGDITAYVPYAARSQYQVKDLLTLGNITVSGGAAVVPGDAVDVNAYFGDVNGDHHIDGLDKGLIANVAATLNTGFTAFTLLDPAIIGDVSVDNAVTANSTSLLSNYLLAQHVAKIPALPNPAIADNLFTSPFASDPTLNLPASVRAACGLANLPIYLDHPRPAGSTGLVEAELTLAYDPKVLSVSAADISLGTIPSQGTGWQLSAMVNTATGQISIQLYSETPITTDQGGSLVNIAFHVKSDAAPWATTTVQLVDSQTVLADTQAAMILSPGLDWTSVLTSDWVRLFR